MSPQTRSVAAHRDIEDLKLTAEALRRSQADLAEARRELQLTIDTIPALVVTYDPDGRCNFVNRTWQDYTGLTLQEAVREGRPDFHPDDIDRVDRAWRASLATGEPFSIELRARRADGAVSMAFHPTRTAARRCGQDNQMVWRRFRHRGQEDRRGRSAAQRSRTCPCRARASAHAGHDPDDGLANPGRWRSGVHQQALARLHRLVPRTGAQQGVAEHDPSRRPPGAAQCLARNSSLGKTSRCRGADAAFRRCVSLVPVSP